MKKQLSYFDFYESGYLIEYNRGDQRFMPSNYYDSDEASEKAAELNRMYGDAVLSLVTMKKEKMGF